jgi:hypothetical protein
MKKFSSKTTHNITRNCLFYLLPFFSFAQGFVMDEYDGGDGIEAPPTASINESLICLFVLAVALAMFHLFKTKNNRKTSKTKFLVLLIFFSGIITTTAQIQNNGILHASDGGIVYLESGTFNFGANTTTSTSKSTPYNATDGKISLGSSATFVTDGNTTQFVDGYAQTRNTTATLLAIGTATSYAPVMITAATNDTGVEAAYVNEAPLSAFNGGLNANVTAVANTEYWIVKGENAILTVSWRASSGLSSFVYADVTLVGYNTITSKWETINAAIDATSVFGGASSLAGSGSITSSFVVVLSNYSAFALGQKGVDCVALVASSGNIKTWNCSSWIGGTPTLADPVSLSAAYSEGSFACNSLNLNVFDVTLSGTASLEIVNGVSGTGKIIMSSEASLVQRNAAATAPTIELTKTTRPIKRFDYVYWSQPISGDAFSQLNNAASPDALTGAFDLKYKYVSGNITSTGGWQNLTATTAGQGYIMRTKQQAPFTDATTLAVIDLTFTGTANNGYITVPIANVTSSTTSARNNNLLANPYPCAIDAEKFLTQNNTLVDGVIYLWRANTTNSGTSGAAYTVADYIAYTRAGSAGYSGAGVDANFNGNIASGQGFKVKAIASGTASFTNCMRVVGNNDQFYRNNTFANNTNTTVNRFKLNLQTQSGIANEILIAYLPETTIAYDAMYDAELNSVSNIKIYSILDNDTKKLVINARPNFTNTDQVSLGLSKPNTESSTLQIAPTQQEGIFANNQTPIYLYDTQTNLYHDFANGSYSFTTNNPTDNSRFKVVYQNGTLDTPDFQNPTLSVVLNQSSLNANASIPMESLILYDLTGRMIENYTNIKATSFSTPFYHAQSLYIVKITHTNGVVVSKKVLKTNN